MGLSSVQLLDRSRAKSAFFLHAMPMHSRLPLFLDGPNKDVASNPALGRPTLFKTPLWK